VEVEAGWVAVAVGSVGGGGERVTRHTPHAPAVHSTGYEIRDAGIRRCNLEATPAPQQLQQI
jgi:hypothetical protein